MAATQPTVDMSKHIVLDGLPPNVVPGKKAAFQNLLNKKMAEKMGHNNFTIKLIDDEDGLAHGAFVDCRQPQEADRAVALMNRFKLTKTTEFIANRWSDFEKAEGATDEYMEPELDEMLSEVDMTNPFMLNEEAKPQLLVKAGDDFHVNWYSMNVNTNKMDAMRKIDGKDETLRQWNEADKRAKKLQMGKPEPLPMWSPLGTYVISEHNGGFKLWGGKNMQLISEIPCNDKVQYISMSPNEKYLVMYSNEFIFRDVRNCKIIRSIPGEVSAGAWPVFKYNADDTMVATVHPSRGTINVYNAETMRLLSQDSTPKFTAQYDGLSQMSWSPTNPSVFASVIQGGDSIGWRVQIDRITDIGGDMVILNQVVRRNYFQTSSLKFLWHPTGKYLAAKITKTNNQVSYGIFKVMDRTASAESVDIVGEPLRFNWQPNAARFGVITLGTAQKKQTITFYSAEKVGFKEIGSFASDTVVMYWAPSGTRCAAMNPDRSRIEFYGVPGSGPFVPPQGKMQQLASVEHPMVTKGEWDPSGRYFCSMTSYLKQEMDNQWMIWSVNGVKLFDRKIPKFSHASWRPVAPTLMSDDDLARIQKNLPAKSKKYTEEALQKQKDANSKEVEKKKRVLQKYRDTMDKIKAEMDEKGYAEVREKLRANAAGAKYNAKLLAEASEVKMTEEEREEMAAEQSAQTEKKTPLLWGISINDEFVVTKIAENSPATKAQKGSLKPDDVLLTVGGRKVKDKKKLIKRSKNKYNAGDKILITAKRGDIEQVQIEITHE